MLIHPGDAARVVTGLGGGVGRVGSGQNTIGVAPQQEILDLGAHPGFESGVGGALDQALQDHPGCIRPRCAPDMGVAVHQGEALFDERNRGERGRIGDRDQVGIFGLLAHGTDGVAGEADALGGQEFDGFDGNQFGAGLSAQVHEQREDELGTGLFGEGGEIGGHSTNTFVSW